MNRVNLLTSTVMTPIERRMGRFMRAPDHPTGDESNSGGDNTGNSGDSGTGNEGQDNSGQSNELEQFWKDPEPEAPSQESLEAEQAQTRQLGQELQGLITGFKAPEAFTKEIADKIADGDLTGINAALAERDQQLLKQTVVLSAKLVGGLVDKMTADFESRIQQALGNRDSEMTLETHFPQAKDPAMRPIVQRVWTQALANSKGNKEKAIELTRGMLRAFGESTSIREPADDPTAGIGTAASKSLVASLLERDG